MPTPTATPPPDWNEVQHWFSLAVAQPAGQREAWLASSGAPPAVRAEVLSLLAHASGGSLAPESFLSEPAALLGRGTAPAAPAAAAAAPRLGERLGAWTLVALAGRGGMGEVYEAWRDDGRYEGRAAVKLLRAGLDSAAVLARFAQEQQALARLDHPNIAHLIDAGHTDDGRPYFVMAWVDGQPIDRACQGRPVAERLRLFLQLADAVSHAHRHLLVHRDLKPGNVLVTPEGQVKLLDFGIAKALDPAEADPDRTQAGERPYTPHYASPEQVRGETVSTATDLYSLGVLLYVMLTGVRPYGRQATTPFDAARSVLEEAPSRASALSPDEVPDADWARTRRRLAGDLDNILLKALAKPVAQRYSSVDALAADIRAHLEGRPVSARAPTAAYLAARFIGRHRAAVGAAALAVLALVGGLAATTWQARVAQHERALAEKRFADVRQLAGQLVFKYHDQLEYLEGATQVREALLVDAAGFLDSLREAAADDPALAYELATTYYRIAMLQGVSQTIHTGEFTRAEANLDKAMALHPLFIDRPDTAPEVVADAVDMRVSRAELSQRRGRMTEAVAMLRAGLPTLDALLRRHTDDPNVLTSAIGAHGVLARMLGTTVAHANLGRLDEAREHLDTATALARRLLAPSPANVESLNTLAFTLGELANWHAQRGEPDKAAEVFTEQLALRDRNALSKPDDAQFQAQRINVRGNLAGALAQAGRAADARQRMDEALSMATRAAATDPGNAAAQTRVQTLRILEARLRVIVGDAPGARQALDTALPTLPAGPSFAQARWRCEALLWAARAWRDADPARALRLATEAAGLMAGSDENAARVWMLALARGERALAERALGDPRAGADAREALETWASAPGGGPMPGSFERYVLPVRAVADAVAR